MKLVYLNPQLNPHAMHPYYPYNTSTFAASHLLDKCCAILWCCCVFNVKKIQGAGE